MFCLYIVLFTSNILVYAQITMLVSSSLQCTMLYILQCEAFKQGMNSKQFVHNSDIMLPTVLFS